MFASRINPVAIVGILGIGLLAVFLGMAAAESLNFSNLFILMVVVAAA